MILRAPVWDSSIKKYRVSMCFVRCPAPNRSVKEFAVELSLYFNLHWNSQILAHRSQDLRRTPLLQRPGLSEQWKQISQCECQTEPPIPSCFFSRLDPAAKALSTKTDFVNAFLSSISQCRSVFPNQISRCAFHRKKVECTRFTLLMGQMLRGFCTV